MAVKSLKEQLAQLALKNVKMSDDSTLAETMKREANRLYDCIQFYINEYYDSYYPKIYDRTGDYRRSLKAEDIADIRVVGDTLRIGVVFDYGLAMHPNLEGVVWNDGWFDLDRHETFVPLMMETGWYAPKLASIIGRQVYRLTYFEGIGAVEKGIKRFNRTNKLGIKIDAENFYRGRAY